MFRSNNQNSAMMAVVCSGVVWGILWIPLRALHHADINGMWAVAVFYALPVIVLTPFYILRWRRILRGGVALQMPSLLAGLALVLYAGALLHTQVINAMLLYYLTPLWSTLLAKYILGESIYLNRFITMILAFAGMMVVLNLDIRFSSPESIGDWMGFSSGIIWAFAAVYIKKGSINNSVDVTLCYFLWGSIFALIFTQIPLGEFQPPPSLASLYDMLFWMIPVVVLLIIPPALAVLWGATILSPGILGILFMTEISTGAVSAAIWSNEPFGIRELLGITLISLAGLWEPLCNWKSLKI